MKTSAASELLAALGHESRLAIYRLLVEAGTAGLCASAIGVALGALPATLSFHLAHLSRVGLVRAKQEGRFIFYSADYAVMDKLLGFLTQNCCQGEPCLTTVTQATRAAKKKTAAQKINTGETICPRPY